MLIPITFDLKRPKPITTEDVRAVIQEISQQFYGDILDNTTLQRLNDQLEMKVNQVFGLNIKAEKTPSSSTKITLFGYDEDSKAVLDPNCDNKVIQTNLPPWRRR
jgi:hypothetical protein